MRTQTCGTKEAPNDEIWNSNRQKHDQNEATLKGVKAHTQHGTYEANAKWKNRQIIRCWPNLSLLSALCYAARTTTIISCSLTHATEAKKSVINNNRTNTQHTTTKLPNLNRMIFLYSPYFCFLHSFYIRCCWCIWGRIVYARNVYATAVTAIFRLRSNFTSIMHKINQRFIKPKPILDDG